MTATIEDVVAPAKDDDIRLVRFLYCDPAGVIRGKNVHVARLASRMREGIGMTRAQNTLNMLDQLPPLVEGMEPVGEVRDHARPGHLQRPRLGARHGEHAQRPARPRWPGLGQLSAELPQACHRRCRDARASGSWPPSRTSSTSPTRSTARWCPGRTDRATRRRAWTARRVVMSDIVDSLVAQGIEVEQAINEYGPGQQEIAVRYRDALGAADQQLKFRDTVRGVTETQHGLIASFAPKPFAAGVGSGAHVHFSLWSPDGCEPAA